MGRCSSTRGWACAACLLLAVALAALNLIQDTTGVLNGAVIAAVAACVLAGAAMILARVI
jgi:hypothetical protein